MSKERAAQLVEAGVWLKLSGDLEGARKLFERAAKLDPDNERVKQLLEGKGEAPAPEPEPPMKIPTPRPQPQPPSGPELDWGVATGFKSQIIDTANLDADWGKLTGGTPGFAPQIPPVTEADVQRAPKRTLQWNAPSSDSNIQLAPQDDRAGKGTLLLHGANLPDAGASAPNPAEHALTITISGEAPIDSPPPSTPPIFARPKEGEEEIVLATISVSPVPGSLSISQTQPPPAVEQPPLETPRVETPRPPPPVAPAHPSPPTRTTALSWISSMERPQPEPEPGPVAGEEPSYPAALDPWADEASAPAAADPESLGFAWSWSASTPAAAASPPRTLDDAAESAWDASSNPGIKLETVVESGAALDLIDPGRVSKSAVVRQKNEIDTLLKGARDLLELDDHSGAMELIAKAEALAPDDADVKALKVRSEQTLLTMFESKLGKLESVPRVLLKDDEIIWLNLDHRAGFVLAQIDGTVSFDDLFSVSGMSRLDTARILAQLVEEGVISRG